MQQIPPDEVASVGFTVEPAEQIEPGVWRIPLPLPFALREANAYLLSGGGEHVLVDCGLGTPDGSAALDDGLRRAGVRRDQITTIIITHAHPDHIGLSGAVHEASGAPLRMLAEEAERLYHVWGDSQLRALRASNALFAAHGMPAEDEAHASRSDRHVQRAIQLPPAESVVAITSGETLPLAGATYRAVWTPGHSDFHLCLLRADGLFLSGDHILPRITPNIGLYPNARPNPLGDYYTALATVRDLPARLVLPGHGRPFGDLVGRVDELRAHHEERSALALALLAAHAEGASGFTIAQELFGRRLRTPDDRRFALAETLAHLEYLRHAGQITRDEREGRVLYRAAQVARAAR